MTISEIENIIAEILVKESAYNLPYICERYDLDYGTENEAMMSKMKYIEKRLKVKNHLFIIDLAGRIAQDYESKELLRAIESYNDMNRFMINGNTRRALVDEIINGDMKIEGELNIVQFLNRIWDLRKISSAYGYKTNMEESVYQHMIRNDDWSYSDLLDIHFDLIGSEDKIFTKFIETLVDPIVRKGSEQKKMLRLINSYLIDDNYRLLENGSKLGMPTYKLRYINDGVEGLVKNIIFAADGPKPEIVLIDAVNNDIDIVENKENCLIFDQTIPKSGLKWIELVGWWKRSSYHNTNEENVERELFLRLEKTLDKNLEVPFFRKYYNKFKDELGSNLPALIPQVYLHYDPKTIKQLNNKKRLERQRMDFLMLLSDKHRIIIEIDGKHHYADKDKASPKLYSDMVAEDRRMKLSGYDIYRFGGYELTYCNLDLLIEEFFRGLFNKYNITRS